MFIFYLVIYYLFPLLSLLFGKVQNYLKFGLLTDFLKDCGGPIKKKPSLDSCTNGNSNLNGINSNKEANTSIDKNSHALEEREKKYKVTEIFEYAGEKLRFVSIDLNFFL